MQSFGIPETAEKLGFFKLRLCENLFLRVFHGGTKIPESFGIPETADKLGFF